MRTTFIVFLSLLLAGCSKGSAENPNEVFVDSLLDKHLTRPQGSSSKGPPKQVVDSIKSCARPSLLLASKDISSEDKNKILNMLVSVETIEQPPEPSSEELTVYQPLASMLAGCMAAASMQSEMTKDTDRG